MSLALAISTAISGVQTAGSSRNPSESTLTTVSAMVAVGISSLRWWCGGLDRVLAGHRHLAGNARDVAAGQQQVPIEPLEHQLADVVQVRLLEQRERSEARC